MTNEPTPARSNALRLSLADLVRDGAYAIHRKRAHCHHCGVLGTVVSRANRIRPGLFRKTDLCEACAIKEHGDDLAGSASAQPPPARMRGTDG